MSFVRRTGALPFSSGGSSNLKRGQSNADQYSPGTSNDVRREVLPEFSEPQDFPNSPLQRSKAPAHSVPLFIKKSNQRKEPNENRADLRSQRASPYYRSTANNDNGSPMQIRGYRGSSESTTKPFRQSFEVDSDRGSFVSNSRFTAHTSKGSLQNSTQEFQQEIPQKTVPRTRNMEYFSMGPSKSAKNAAYEDNKKKNSLTVGSKFRHLTGSVDHVVHWHKVIRNQEYFIIYEASGVLESMLTQGVKQLLFLRANSGHVLQGIFYAIDRELPQLQPGSIVTATGRMVGSNKLHVFDAVETTKEEQRAAERLWFLCQRSVEALT